MTASAKDTGIYKRANQFLERIEGRPFYAHRVLLTVLIVGLCRGLLNVFLAGEIALLATFSFWVSWYLVLFVGLSVIVAALTGRSWRNIIHVMYYGILLGIVPPLLDAMIYGARNFSYDSVFSGTGWLVSLTSGVPLGEQVAVWTAIGLCAIYIGFRKRSVYRGVVGAGAAFSFFYFLLVLLGQAASFLAAGALQGTLDDPKMLLTLAYILTALVFYWIGNFQNLKPSLLRIHHALPWLFVVLLGAAVSNEINALSVLLAVVTLFLHWAIVMVNDYYDRTADAENREVSLLDSEDAILLNGFVVFVGIVFALRATMLGALFLLYFLATFAYHHDSMRLKQICPINYKIEGIVAALAFTIGLVSGTGNFLLDEFQVLGIFLIFGGFALVSMFKDYKDIEADRGAQVHTIYTVLLDREWSLDRIHMVVRVIVGVCLSIPVVLAVIYVPRTVPAAIVLLIVAAAIQWTLHLTDRSKAVARTLWLLNMYLAILALSL